MEFFIPLSGREHKGRRGRDGHGSSRPKKAPLASPLPPARLCLPSSDAAALNLGRRGEKTSYIDFFHSKWDVFSFGVKNPP